MSTNHKIEKSTDGTSRMSNSNYRPSDVLKEGYKLQFSSIFGPITIEKISSQLKECLLWDYLF